jgi:hypothetical protein
VGDVRIKCQGVVGEAGNLIHQAQRQSVPHPDRTSMYQRKHAGKSRQTSSRTTISRARQSPLAVHDRS